MVISRWLTVRCVNGKCANPASADVPVPEVASGVLAYPSVLRCKACNQDLKVVNDAAQQG